MAIGTTFDTLQAAILAEDELAFRKANSFRDYLSRQAQNRNQGRQVGVNQFDAQTRRDLGFRNADEMAAERDRKYGFMDRELESRDSIGKSNIEILREQLRQRSAADDEATRLKSELAYLEAGGREAEIAARLKIASDQLQAQKSWYDLQQNPRPTEAYKAKSEELISAERDKQRLGELVASTINSSAKSKASWWSGKPDFDKAFSEVAGGPLAKHIGLVRFDPQTNQYVSAVNADELRTSLLGQGNQRISNQSSVSLDSPKSTEPDYVAEVVNGRYVIKGMPTRGVTDHPALDARPAPPGDGGLSPRTMEWRPSSPDESAAVQQGIDTGVMPSSGGQDALQLLGHTPESYRQALSGEFRRRLSELEGTPAGTSPLLAPLYSDIARRRSIEPSRIGGSTVFRTPQSQARSMAGTDEMAAWEAGLTPDEWNSLFRAAIAESYRNPRRGYDNFVGQ